MRRSRWTWLAAACVLLLVTAALWLRTGEGPPQSGAQTEAGGAPPQELTEPTPGAPPGLSSLPDELAVVLPVQVRDLLARANAGEPRAACQLGSLLAQCGLTSPRFYSDEFVESMRKQERDAEKQGDIKAANQAASALLVAKTRQQRCKDIPVDLLERAGAYLRQAALAGDREAQVRYVRGDAFLGIGFSDNQSVRSPHLDQWRREAPGMLQAQLRQGRPEAVLLALEAYSQSGAMLSLVTPPDPLLDRAYLQLAARIFEDFRLPKRWIVPPPDEALDREAQELARRWHAEHFDGKRYSMRRETLGLSNALLPLENEDWVDESNWVPACADPPGSNP